jgi:hypothetical protein
VSIFIESRYKVIWRLKVEIDYTVWSISCHNLLRDNAKNKIKCGNTDEVKKRWSGNNHLVQAQVKEIYFIFNLEYRYAVISRGMLHRLSIKCHAQQKPKYSSDMSETQRLHTLHISLNQKKPSGPVSQTRGSSLGRWAPMASFQILDVLVSKTGCFSFYWLVSNG